MIAVDWGRPIPSRLKVPKDTKAYADLVLDRLYEPNNNTVPEGEINPRSKMGQFRSPEYCYGFKALGDYSGTIIIGPFPKLDHVLDLMAGYDISRVQGQELVKLLIAKKFVEGIPGDKKTPEDKRALARLERAVQIAWGATMQ
jgi:hypothetical protein